MTKKASLIVLIAVFMLFSSFCRAGTSASDAYFKGIELASQEKFEEAKAEFQKSLDDDSVYSYAKLELHAIDDVLKQKDRLVPKKETGFFLLKTFCF